MQNTVSHAEPLSKNRKKNRYELIKGNGMKLKLYILASLILIIATAIYTFFYFGDGIVIHKLFSLELAMPLYIWVIIPMALLFIASLFHMLYYGIKLKMDISRWSKDSLNLQDSVNALFIGKNKRYNIKHKELKEIADALNFSDVKISGNIDTMEKSRFYTNLDINRSIYSGKYVKLSKSGYEKDAPILEQNLLNRLDVELDFAKQVVKNSENYSTKIKDKAISLYATAIEPKELPQYIALFNSTAVKELLKRIANNEFTINKETISLLFEKCLDKELLTLTKAVKQQLQPDEALQIFTELYEKDERAKEFYIYLLLEYEMLDKAREILVEEARFDNFKAYLDLIDAGKRYPLHMFV